MLGIENGTAVIDWEKGNQTEGWEMEKLLVLIHGMIWGPWMLALFLGTGILFTVRTGFFQIYGFPVWWKKTAGSVWRGLLGSCKKSGCEKKEGITQVQSVCTVLAATIGTGNIVGVCTAIRIGGPGALFWMWISAALGMMTAYGEVSLGQKYRYRQEGGNSVCGPMAYMERGLGCQAMGKLYAFFMVLTSLGMGSMVQANAMSQTMGALVLPAVKRRDGIWFDQAKFVFFILAVLITLTAAAVILGGIRRISAVAEGLVPVSAGIFLLFSILVLISCFKVLPEVFQMIGRDAFRLDSAGGGISGFLVSRQVRYGLSRGVFSNEAGLGSLSVLHGTAEEKDPVGQGMWAMFEVFFDTIVICTLTGMVILCVGCEQGGFPAHLEGAALTAWCFAKKLGRAGEWLVSGFMAVFAFATIIAWYYLGCQALEYLAADVKSDRKKEIVCHLYTVSYLMAVYLGCMFRMETVWILSDIWNGVLAYPNLLSLWLLSKKCPDPLDNSWQNLYTKFDKRE